MKGKELSLSHCMAAATIAGLAELLMSDLAGNQPKDSPEEEISQLQDAARRAHVSQLKFMGLMKKKEDA